MGKEASNRGASFLFAGLKLLYSVHAFSSPFPFLLLGKARLPLAKFWIFFFRPSPLFFLLDKSRLFLYSMFIAFASVKGRAFKEVRGHKSGPVLHCSGPSMLDFTLADGTRKSFAGGSVFHSGLGYVVNNERHAT